MMKLEVRRFEKGSYSPQIEHGVMYRGDQRHDPSKDTHFESTSTQRTHTEESDRRAYVACTDGAKGNIDSRRHGACYSSAPDQRASHKVRDFELQVMAVD